MIHRHTSRSTDYPSRGMTLIEVLIAMVIGLLLLSGAISLFINNKRVFQENNQSGRLQESARFSIELISKDIRHAGFVGCHHNINNISNTIDIPSTLTDRSLYSISRANSISLVLEGLESSDTQWRPSGNTTALIPAATAVGERVVGTDAITVRYLTGNHWDVVAPFMASLTEPVLIDVNNNFIEGELLAVSDCSNSQIFQLGADCASAASIARLNSSASCSSGADGRISTGTEADADISPGNTTNFLDRIYGEGTKVRRYVAVRYYIGVGAYGGPSLYRQVLRNVTNSSSGTILPVPELSIENEELVEGVENMQIMYGLDSNEDGIPDSYATAIGVGAANWNNVISVKFALLIRTINQNFSDDDDVGTYDLLGNVIDPADLKVRRRVFVNTVQVRNRIRDNTS